MAEAEGVKSREGLEQDIFSERFLIRRPLLRALQRKQSPMQESSLASMHTSSNSPRLSSSQNRSRLLKHGRT